MSKPVVVITGSSRGIGRAAVDVFLNEGYRVFGLHTSDVELPTGAESIRTDISDESSVSSAFDQISQVTDRVEALVNNAAVQVNASLVETTTEDWDRVMNVNLRGFYLVTKAAYPLLRNSGQASIVNVASVHAFATSRGIAAYAASKGAIVALTRACALEMAQDGIRVNCVIPGAVDTPMLRDGFQRGHLTSDSVLKQMEELADRTPLRKIGQPQEIARVIHFLASPVTSSFITGQNIVADGGALARLSTE